MRTTSTRQTGNASFKWKRGYEVGYKYLHQVPTHYYLDVDKYSYPYTEASRQNCTVTAYYNIHYVIVCSRNMEHRGGYENLYDTCVKFILSGWKIVYSEQGLIHFDGEVYTIYHACISFISKEMKNKHAIWNKIKYTHFLTPWWITFFAHEYFPSVSFQLSASL